MTERATVVAVSRSARHGFSKPTTGSIDLVEGWGVEGDAHAGVTVQHRHDKRYHPERPNLRQVHLLAQELLAEVAAEGWAVDPGGLGENVTTRGVDLLALPTGTVLHLGGTAAVRLTGLRSPCRQIDGLAPGLMARLVGRDADGGVVRRAGVMAVVVAGGPVQADDTIVVERPPGTPVPLGPV
ncbi:MOSC domain-containing protein [Cellulomonas marina]|uniref:MOSC domain-containing protein YiiM n=1 Tax=Cellulomonas marina TaxID=988821 RepID=A0A1I0X7I5_9CELL|nr:MOSC domain-containing protein [Cellulomonas marina]GIG29473.1 MOSC domain-containing protein [Cellulomonas marina]SFA96637.1 MOSC domain-containing protein YiiM [Cellulomonas marina]